MTKNCSGRCVNTTPPSIEAPDPNSAELMAYLDRLSKPMRALVHEYGAAIVMAMIGEGYGNAAELRDVLETWRERKQEQWLAEIPYPSLGSRCRMTGASG